MNRRNVLAAAAAALVAQAVPAAEQALPVLYGDGVANDMDALCAWVDGRPVQHRGRLVSPTKLPPGLRLNVGVSHPPLSRGIESFQAGDAWEWLDWSGADIYAGDSWLAKGVTRTWRRALA